MKMMKFEEYEQEILDAFERGEIKIDKLAKNDLQKYQRIAHNTIKKDKRVNIRISSMDLEKIQLRAVREGIPYQTLMTSVLHKFVSGQLTDNITNQSIQVPFQS
ncbi:MAG: antitoxin [Endomicrobiales bacterium]